MMAKIKVIEDSDGEEEESAYPPPPVSHGADLQSSANAVVSTHIHSLNASTDSSGTLSPILRLHRHL